MRRLHFQELLHYLLLLQFGQDFDALLHRFWQMAGDDLRLGRGCQLLERSLGRSSWFPLVSER